MLNQLHVTNTNITSEELDAAPAGRASPGNHEMPRQVSAKKKHPSKTRWIHSRKLTAGGPQNDGLEKVTGPF